MIKKNLCVELKSFTMITFPELHKVLVLTWKLLFKNPLAWGLHCRYHRSTIAFLLKEKIIADDTSTWLLQKVDLQYNWS